MRRAISGVVVVLLTGTCLAVGPGEIVGWGWNDEGQASPPVGTDYEKIAEGRDHGLALKSDGSVIGWGCDDDGQASPPSGTDYVVIAGGWTHSLGLKSDGSMVGWGNDYEGEASPPSGTDYGAIAAGAYYSLALKVPPPVPELINYQGRVNDSVGDPLDGVAVYLTFRFYDAPTEGNLLLTVQQADVQVRDGVFNVLIGSGTVIAGTEDTLSEVLQNHGAVWMSTGVEPDWEMMPRQRIASVGYAFSAGKATTAEDLSHIEPRNTAPETPTAGDLYIDASDGNRLKIYDGTTWQACW